MRKTIYGAGLLSAMLLLVPSSPAQGNVLVVDDDGGYEYTEIYAAVEAAVDGDTILVRDGSYTWFRIDGKSLAVIAESGSEVRATRIAVEHLALDQQVLLRGIDAGSQGMDLKENTGVVWIEDAHFQSSVTLADCDAVHFTRIQVVGATLRANDSNVTIWDSRLTGASGRGPTCQTIPPGIVVCSPPTAGDDALYVSGGTVFVSNSTIQGGRGGDGLARGGDGLVLANRDPQVTTLGSNLLGGSGRPSGRGVVIYTGSHTELSGTGRSLEVTSPHRERETAVLSFSGEPGDLVFVAFGTEPAYGSLPGFPDARGVLAIELTAIMHLGSLDATGALAVPATLPFLPAGVAATHVYLQPLFIGDLATTPVIFMGSGSALSILGASL